MIRMEEIDASSIVIKDCTVTSPRAIFMMGYPTRMPLWHYGMVVTTDYWDGAMMMLICPIPAHEALRRKIMYGQWNAIVLTSAGTWTWRVGDIATLSPDGRGLRIVRSPEEDS